MISAATSTFAAAPLWFITRAAGVVSFLLLTVTFALGLAATRRARLSPNWPRLLTQQLHRNIALIGIGMLVVHIFTSIADSYVTISWLAWLVPGASSYERIPVALGTLAFDGMLLLVVTSLVRDRLSHRFWRTVHWTAYGVWPFAFLHFLTAGTDARTASWGRLLALAALVLLGLATWIRWATRERAAVPPAVQPVPFARISEGQRR